MERTLRLLELWTTLAWAVMATGVWAANGVTAATSDDPPPIDGLVFLVAMALVGVSIAMTVQMVLALLRVGYYSDKATPDSGPAGVALGIAAMGFATARLLDGSPQTMDWVMIGLLSFIGGFALLPSPVRRLAPDNTSPSRRDPHAVE